MSGLSFSVAVRALVCVGVVASHVNGWAAPAAELQKALDAALQAARECRAAAAEEAAAPDQMLRRAALEASRKVRPVEARLRAGGATSRRLDGEVAELSGQVQGLGREVARLQAVLAGTARASDPQVAAGLDKEIADKRARMDELDRQIRQRQGELLAAARKADELERELVPLALEARVLEQQVAASTRQCPP